MNLMQRLMGVYPFDVGKKCCAVEPLPTPTALAGIKQKPRIHLFDVVTSSEHSMIDRMFRVTGALQVGEMAEVGGLWKLQDLRTDEERTCPGCFLTVWRPVSRPPKK